MPDLAFILLLALLIFGPKKFPEVARQIAKLVTQLRMMSTDLRRQIEDEMLKIERDEKEKQVVAQHQISAAASSSPAETVSQAPQS